MSGAPQPVGLLAELTHRCPLHCPYCSNPLSLDRRRDEIDASVWDRVFREARALGVLQVHLSGGEPAARPDLEQIVAAAADAGLYTNLITSGYLLDAPRLQRLRDAGLDHVQLSLQGAENDEAADRVAGRRGAQQRKRELARAIVGCGLPLTLNLVVHRGNIGDIEAGVRLALGLGAQRIEVAHVQYHGWALANRAALIPTRTQVDAAERALNAARDRHGDRLAIDSVPPDYYARWPKPCMGGWGRRALVVTPAGKALPCHAAESIPELSIPNVLDWPLGEIWESSSAFAAFRGTDWMEAPCVGCERKLSCRGGCRCQALALTGRTTAADPTCHLSSHNRALRAAAEAEAQAGAPTFLHRRMATRS